VLRVEDQGLDVSRRKRNINPSRKLLREAPVVSSVTLFFTSLRHIDWSVPSPSYM
jgi:hypothetical protein